MFHSDHKSNLFIDCAVMNVCPEFLYRLIIGVMPQSDDLPLSHYCIYYREVAYTPPPPFTQRGLILMLRQLKLTAFLAILLVSTGYKYWFSNKKFGVSCIILFSQNFNIAFQMCINKKQICKCRPCNVQIMILLFQKFLECSIDLQVKYLCSHTNAITWASLVSLGT